MKFTPTGIAGAYVIDLEPKEDSRGSFARAFCRDELAQIGLRLEIAQCNLARTRHSGVIRGLHFQLHPALEAKMIRCVAGAIFDVLVDMRPESSTYHAVHCETLDSAGARAIFVPAGVAHGYQSMTNSCDVYYMTDAAYSPGAETGVRYDDPKLAIPWPLPPRDVTQRDQGWPLLT
jgi:dTDP-4-dehydrorhamnose 3,5-epimerase